MRARLAAVHGCGATIIDRPQLLSIARDCYQSSAIMIDRVCHTNRGDNLLIMIIASDYHYYSIIFMHKGVLTKSTPF
ncbi:hypothetical protein [Microcoleus sp. F4-D5]|uniref:hypothetical protein n=1 Tax=Microcoleus sp. F4-D5 TaxID=2818760 RepID=UPI002FD022CD